MLFLNCSIIFIFLIFIDLTNQLTLIPYWIKLIEGKSRYEYNGRSFKTIKELIKRLICRKKIDKKKDVCLYNVGFKKGHIASKTFVKVCESKKAFFSRKYRSITYSVKKFHTHEHLYHCNKKNFTKFDNAIEYSLTKKCNIEFDAPHANPSFPIRRYCISTISGKKCLSKNLATFHFWEKIWHHCTYNCYNKKNFKIAIRHFLQEINAYRQFVGSFGLVVDDRLSNIAKKRAEKMAKMGKLKSDKDKTHDEIIIFGKHNNGMLAMKILFDDVWFNKKTTKKKMIKHKKKDFMRLLGRNQQFIGIGMKKNKKGVYICVKFTHRIVKKRKWEIEHDEEQTV